MDDRGAGGRRLLVRFALALALLGQLALFARAGVLVTRALAYRALGRSTIARVTEVTPYLVRVRKPAPAWRVTAYRGKYEFQLPPPEARRVTGTFDTGTVGAHAAVKVGDPLEVRYLAFSPSRSRRVTPDGVEFLVGGVALLACGALAAACGIALWTGRALGGPPSSGRVAARRGDETL